jgi:uncharacterized protein YqgC (DUF456 family)
MEWYEITLLSVGALLSIAGIAGCIIPIMPGPPLNYAALLLIEFTNLEGYSLMFFVIFGVVTLLTILLDIYLPAAGARYFGASKGSVWGAVIGGFVGLFVLSAFGMLIGMLVGAFIGELAAGKTHQEALKASTVSFIASVFMIVLKLSVSITMTVYFAVEIV